MKAIILAAGRGSRMGSGTSDSPKCLHTFKGKPLIENTIGSLENFFSRKDIKLVTGYQASKLNYLGLDMYSNDDWASTNIMGSLLVMDAILSSEETLVTYSDVYYEPEAISQLLAHKTPSVLSTERWLEVWSKRFLEPLTDLENFMVNNDGVLTKIGGHSDSINEIMGQFAGVYSMNPLVWRWVKSKISDLAMRDTTFTLNEITTRSPFRIEVAKYEGVWAEIDTLSDATSQV